MISLEQLLTRPEGFGLETATPIQRALCRLLSGAPLGDLARHPDVLRAFGGAVPPEGHVREVVVLAAIRSAKTLIAAATAVHVSQTADLSRIRAGEIPRFTIMSTAKDQAEACLDHLVGTVMAKPILRQWVIGEPKADGITLRHPSGKPVEIKVVAGSRAGATLVARWSVGGVFDEAPRMIGADDGVVNLEDARRAILGRVLPGCPLLYIGSPWAPFGPVYNWVQESFGAPTRQRVVVRAPGPLMNPTYWTPEKCEELRLQDPVAYKTDVEGDFADPEEALFTETLLDRAARARRADPERHHYYVAAMDPATRNNAWTFAVATARDGEFLEPTIEVVYHRQWSGRMRDKRRPREVLQEIADVCEEYDLDEVHTDQYAADALADIADEVGITLIDHAITRVMKHEQVMNLRTLMDDGRFLAPDDPTVRKDLQMVRRRVTQDGVAIVYPQTSDGRHCDYVPTLALLADNPPEAPDDPEPFREEMEKRRERLRNQEEQDPWEQIESRLLGG